MTPRSLKNEFNQSPTDEEMGSFVGAAYDGDVITVVAFLKKYPESMDALTYFSGRNRRSYVDTTALIEAAAGGRKDIVELLLKNGAAIDKNTQHDWTALSAAIRNGHIDIVRLLLDNGADIDGRHPRGWTPLMEAISYRHLDIVKFLLGKGASINKKYGSDFGPGKTALEIAEGNNIHLASDKSMDAARQIEALLVKAEIEKHLNRKPSNIYKPKL